MLKPTKATFPINFFPIQFFKEQLLPDDGSLESLTFALEALSLPVFRPSLCLGVSKFISLSTVNRQKQGVPLQENEKKMKYFFFRISLYPSKTIHPHKNQLPHLAGVQLPKSLDHLEKVPGDLI